MQEQWSRVLILSSRKSVVYKFKCQKLKEKRNLDFLVSVCILKVLLMLETTFSEKIYTRTKFLPMHIQHYIDAIGDIGIVH